MTKRSSPPLLAAVVLLLGCAGGPPPGEEHLAWTGPLTTCEDPRPTDCGFERAQPVCGRRHATWRQFRNRCTACRDKAVSGFHEGTCAGLMSPQEQLGPLDDIEPFDPIL